MSCNEVGIFLAERASHYELIYNYKLDLAKLVIDKMWSQNNDILHNSVSFLNAWPSIYNKSFIRKQTKNKNTVSRWNFKTSSSKFVRFRVKLPGLLD